MAIFECRNLSMRYGQNFALSKVDLSIEPGGIVGLLGPNGSGKTTLIKLAMGLLQPCEGEILLGGLSPSPKTKAFTAYLPDSNYLNMAMRVEWQVEYYADFFPDFEREKAYSMLGRLEIDRKSKIKTLSKGNREKLGLILTMSRHAKLYILDEPIAGVDPAARDFILDTILKNKPEDATIFLCTHLISDIEPVLTHAVFLGGGKVILNAPADEIRSREGKSLNDVFREVFRW